MKTFKMVYQVEKQEKLWEGYKKIYNQDSFQFLKFSANNFFYLH